MQARANQDPVDRSNCPMGVWTQDVNWAINSSRTAEEADSLGITPDLPFGAKDDILGLTSAVFGIKLELCGQCEQGSCRAETVMLRMLGSGALKQGPEIVLRAYFENHRNGPTPDL